jgi:hypothetical protein
LINPLEPIPTLSILTVYHIAAAVEVHWQRGPGFEEAIYQRVLALELLAYCHDDRASVQIICWSMGNPEEPCNFGSAKMEYKRVAN